MSAIKSAEAVTLVPGFTSEGKISKTLVPPPPKLRVVTSGWWGKREERKSLEEVQALYKTEA